MQIPDTMNEDLLEILGLICFRAAPIAHVMQAAGEPIAKRAEHEQAHVIHKLLGFYAEHGAEWRAAAADWLEALQEKVRAAKAEAGQV